MSHRLNLAMKIAAGSLLGVMLFAFQNCTGVASKAGTQNGQSSVGTGIQNNGTGYGGKTYTQRILNGLCADGTNIKARLVTISSNAATITRENCAETEGRPVTIDKVILGGDATASFDSVLVEGMIFDEASGATTALTCYGENTDAGRATTIVLQTSGSQFKGHFRSDSLNTTTEFSFFASASSSNDPRIYSSTSPANAEGWLVKLSLFGESDDGLANLEVTNASGAGDFNQEGLECVLPADPPEEDVVAPIPRETSSSTTTNNEQSGQQCSNSTLSSKPSVAQFMSQASTDVSTASAVLYGVIGSNFDGRDWEDILSSGDLLNSVRAATAQMYNGQYCRSLSAVQTGSIASYGNLQLQNVNNVYSLKIVDGEGYTLTTISNCASAPRVVLNYGFNYGSINILRIMVAATGSTAAKQWMAGCPVQ